MVSSVRPMALVCGFFVLSAAVPAAGQVVPGSGRQLTQVGDDFEDANWQWVPSGEKASKEQDEQIRSPLGYSTNRRWFESPKRGMPDTIQRVATPAGGIPGSQGALLLRTVYSGVPGRISYQMMQDDLVVASASRIGMLPVSRTPQTVVRVYLPPFEQWENRTGTHFGYRIDLKTTKVEEKKKRRFFLTRKKKETIEPYWPGFFFEFHSETDPKYQQDDARLLIRGNHLGREVASRRLTPGWWTLGMSVTPDGRVHFYASPGVDNLTAADYLYSSFPYGYKAEQFATQFFNVVNMDNGRTPSTTFIIDDPTTYVGR